MITEPVTLKRSPQPVPVLRFVLWGSAGGFLLFINLFSVNVPFIDDYLILFSVLKIAQPGQGVSDVIAELFSQHNEHRVFIARLAAYTGYLFEGELNFRTLIWVGSISILVLYGLFCRLYREANISEWALLPVALLLFQPSYYHNIVWFLSAWQHTVTISGFILLFCLTFSSQRIHIWVPPIMGVVLLYSNSNGFFACLSIILLLFYYGRRQEAALWLGVTVLFSAIYFAINYHFYTQSNARSSLHHPVWVFKSLIGFLGGAVYMNSYAWFKGISAVQLVWLLGTLVLGVFGFSWWNFLFRRRREPSGLYPVLIALSMLLFCTGVAASVARSNGELMIFNRYQIYSILCLITAYSLLILELKETAYKWHVAGVSLAMAFFAFNSYIEYIPELKNRQRRLIAEAAEVQANNRSLALSVFLAQPYYNQLLFECREKEIYRVPAYASYAVSAIRSLPKLSVPTTFARSEFIDTDINKRMIVLQNSVIKAPDFLLLRSTHTIHFLPAERQPQQGRLNILTRTSLFNEGMISSFYELTLPPGRYQVGLLRLSADTPHVEWTNQYIKK